MSRSIHCHTEHNGTRQWEMLGTNMEQEGGRKKWDCAWWRKGEIKSESHTYTYMQVNNSLRLAHIMLRAVEIYNNTAFFLISWGTWNLIFNKYMDKNGTICDLTFSWILIFFFNLGGEIASGASTYSRANLCLLPAQFPRVFFCSLSLSLDPLWAASAGSGLEKREHGTWNNVEHCGGTRWHAEEVGIKSEQVVGRTCRITKAWFMSPLWKRLKESNRERAIYSKLALRSILSTERGTCFKTIALLFNICLARLRWG